MSAPRTCPRSDRDEPRLICGYPLPCPFHTVTIESTATETVVTIPLERAEVTRHYRRLLDVGDAIGTPPGKVRK